MQKQRCPFQRRVSQRWSTSKQRDENDHCQKVQKNHFKLSTLNSQF